MKVTRLIRYPVDVISVLTVVCTLALQLTALVLDWPWYAVLPMIFLARGVSLVQHNHVHLTVFRSSFLNELLGWMCHLSNGVPLYTYRVHHVLNHHRYNNRFDGEQRDWSSLFGFQGKRYPDRPVSRAYYLASFPFIAHGESLLWFLRSPSSRLTRGFFVSVLLVGAVSAYLVWLNPAGFVKFFVVVWVLMIVGIGNSNYEQHTGCKMTNPFDSSNDSLSFFGTVLSFNLGYHVAHHLKPNMHWSLLPLYHKQIETDSVAPSPHAPDSTTSPARNPVEV